MATYGDLKTVLNDRLHNKLGSVGNLRATINQAVSDLNSLTDFRSTRRQLGAVIGFFNEVYEVPGPSDMKDTALIDPARLRNRDKNEKWRKTTPAEFWQEKSQEDFLCAVDESSQLVKILVNRWGNSQKLTLHTLDSITDNGTWAASGDATDLLADSYNYLTGAASLSFSTGASATSAILTNSTFTPVDLTSYKPTGPLFLSLYIPTEAAATALTTVTLQWGDSGSAYWSRAITTAHDNNVFRAGWNILRFEWPSSATGSPSVSSVNYAKLTLTLSTLAATDGWRIDQLSSIMGEPYNITYYSKYYWKTSGGTYIQNSTDDSDVLVADTDEVGIHLDNLTMTLAPILRETVDYQVASKNFDKRMMRYSGKYKSERIGTSSRYHRIVNP